MLSSHVHFGLCELWDITTKSNRSMGSRSGNVGNSGRKRVYEGQREREHFFVSLCITEDSDLNINSQRPYRVLIIDYRWAFSARDIICFRRNQLKGYYSAENLRYGSQPGIQTVNGFLKSSRATETLSSKHSSSLIHEKNFSWWPLMFNLLKPRFCWEKGAFLTPKQLFVNRVVWNWSCSTAMLLLYSELLLLLESVFSSAADIRGSSSSKEHWYPLHLTSSSSSTLAPVTWFHTSSHTLLHRCRNEPRGESSCNLTHLEDMFELQTQMRLPRMDNKRLVRALFHWTSLRAFHNWHFPLRLF